MADRTVPRACGPKAFGGLTSYSNPTLSKGLGREWQSKLKIEKAVIESSINWMGNKQKTIIKTSLQKDKKKLPAIVINIDNNVK